MSVQIVTVRIAIDVGNTELEEATATDCVNEALRDLQRAFNPTSSILDYEIDDVKSSGVSAENYEEGDAF